MDTRQGGETLTATLIEAAVETVKDRSSDLADVVESLRSSAADLIAPDVVAERRRRSWLWILLLGIIVVVVLAILRQRSAANETANAEGP
jgi:hypothetical protein